MLTFAERFVDTNGVRLRVLEAGEPSAPLVVLAHGFPELGFSWRHQLPALAEAGYHVLAPDQRGYGQSSKPEPVDAYTVVDLTADIVGLLDDAGADRAVIVGHDFGGVVAWAAPLLHPERFAGVVGVCTPPVPRSRVRTTQAFRRIFGDKFFYILYFQEVGPADEELNRDPAISVRKLFASTASSSGGLVDAGMTAPGPAGLLARIPEPDGLPDWISQAELDHYIKEFTRTGFTPALNWYRCFDRNWELTETTPAATIEVPALFVGGTEDMTQVFARRDRAHEVVSGDYREVMIGGGHWLPQERPAAVNAALLEFLNRLDW